VRKRDPTTAYRVCNGADTRADQLLVAALPAVVPARLPAGDTRWATLRPMDGTAASARARVAGADRLAAAYKALHMLKRTVSGARASGRVPKIRKTCTPFTDRPHGTWKAVTAASHCGGLGAGVSVLGSVATSLRAAKSKAV
jgi:hypothetical protein